MLTPRVGMAGDPHRAAHPELDGPHASPVRFTRYTREWRNRQTRTVQVRVPERVWGFNSPLAHQQCPEAPVGAPALSRRADTMDMGRGARIIVAGCAAAVTLVPNAPAFATSSDRPTASIQALTFIEALAAIPAATRAVTTTRTQYQDARARQVLALAARHAADASLGAAHGTVRETGLALALADRAAIRGQDAIDDAARTMYVSGGTAPTLAEVLLTADSSVGFTRSLLTRQYLAAVSRDSVLTKSRAEHARALAASAAAAAAIGRDEAAALAEAARSEAARTARDVAATQRAADRARGRYRDLMRVTRADRSADYGRIKRCGDWLTRLLARSGFEGENLREAWAVVMRESGGRADAVSATDDLGLFQINTETWQDEEWFDRDLLLTKRYNARVSRQLSRGGRTWYSWGLDGHGRPDARAYVKAGWSQERVESHIVIPYIHWYAQYPCRPSYEKDVTLDLPLPQAQAAGGGVLPH